MNKSCIICTGKENLYTKSLNKRMNAPKGYYDEVIVCGTCKDYPSVGSLYFKYYNKAKQIPKREQKEINESNSMLTTRKKYVEELGEDPPLVRCVVCDVYERNDTRRFECGVKCKRCVEGFCCYKCKCIYIADHPLEITDDSDGWDVAVWLPCFICKNKQYVSI